MPILSDFHAALAALETRRSEVHFGRSRGWERRLPTERAPKRRPVSAILPLKCPKIEEASFSAPYSVSVRDLADTGPKPLDGLSAGLLMHG